MRFLFLIAFPILLLGSVSSLVIPRGDSISSRESSFEERSIVDVNERGLLDWSRDVDIDTRGLGPSASAFDAFDSRELFDVNSLVELEARARSRSNAKKKEKQKPNPPKVLFSGGAKKHMDELGLHGKDRKAVKKYHKNVVKQEMKGKGADSALIKHLGHDVGTVDPKYHVTAQLWDKDNNKIMTSFNDQKTGKTKKTNLHHLYAGSNAPPKVFTNAVDKSMKAKAQKGDKVALEYVKKHGISI